MGVCTGVDVVVPRVCVRFDNDSVVTCGQGLRLGILDVDMCTNCWMVFACVLVHSETHDFLSSCIPRPLTGQQPEPSRLPPPPVWRCVTASVHDVNTTKRRHCGFSPPCRALPSPRVQHKRRRGPPIRPNVSCPVKTRPTIVSLSKEKNIRLIGTCISDTEGPFAGFLSGPSSRFPLSSLVHRDGAPQNGLQGAAQWLHRHADKVST
jgi:hypothetical protein